MRYRTMTDEEILEYKKEHPATNLHFVEGEGWCV